MIIPCQTCRKFLKYNNFTNTHHSYIFQLKFTKHHFNCFVRKQRMSCSNQPYQSSWLLTKKLPGMARTIYNFKILSVEATITSKQTANRYYILSLCRNAKNVEESWRNCNPQRGWNLRVIVWVPCGGWDGQVSTMGGFWVFKRLLVGAKGHCWCFEVLQSSPRLRCGPKSRKVGQHAALVAVWWSRTTSSCDVSGLMLFSGRRQRTVCRHSDSQDLWNCGLFFWILCFFKPPIITTLERNLQWLLRCRVWSNFLLDHDKIITCEED